MPFSILSRGICRNRYAFSTLLNPSRRNAFGYFCFIIQSNVTWFIDFEQRKSVSVNQQKTAAGEQIVELERQWNNRPLFKWNFRVIIRKYHGRGRHLQKQISVSRIKFHSTTIFFFFHFCKHPSLLWHTCSIFNLWYNERYLKKVNLN